MTARLRNTTSFRQAHDLTRPKSRQTMTKQNHTVATHADPERIPLPPRITPFTIAGLYILAAVLWIIFSDYFVDLLIDDPKKQFAIAMAKGVAFVTLSGLLIFYLVSVSHRQLLRATSEARNRGEILRNITENCTAAYFRGLYTNDGKFELIDASSGYLRLANSVPLRTLTTLEEAMACYHPEDRHRLIDTLRAASLSLVPLDLEARLLIEPGIARWFRIQAAPLKLDDGSVRWDGVLLDIDARLRLDAQRRVAMALHERVRDRLEALLEAAIALQRVRDEKDVIATTANGLVNAGWNAVVVSTLDAESRVVNESIAGPEQQALLPMIRARTPATRRADFVLNNNHRDMPRRAILNFTNTDHHNWRHGDSITIPLRDSDSGIAGLIDIAQPADGARPNEDDIRYLETFADLAAGTIERLRLVQRQQEAERRRHESERRLALHIRETPLAYVESDLDHVITYFNPAAEKLFGWKAAEVVGKATWYLLIPDYEIKRVKEEVDAQAIGPDPFRVTNNNVTRDGQEITCVWYNTPLVDDNGIIIGLASMGDDITAQREYEQKIKQALATQRLLTTELDHRVKNALGSLLNLIDFSTQSHTTVESFSKSIRNRVDALSRIHAVLSASSWQSVELRDLITLMIPPDSPGKLSARGPETHIAPRQVGALGMVIHELISNALKYGSLGAEGATADIEWEVTTDPKDTTVRILNLRWREFGGPRPPEDLSPGLGSQLLEGFAGFELRGAIELRYPPTGADHHLIARLDPSDSTERDDPIELSDPEHPLQFRQHANNAH